MRLNSNLTVFLCLGLVYFGQYCFHCEKTWRDNGVFTRKRRYLNFPDGANFVYTIVYVKALMQAVPKSTQFFHEFNIAHPLPHDTSFYGTFKHGHRMQRRTLLDDVAMSLDRYGLNGTACVKRIVCEAKQLIPFKGKSLIRDMLSEIFLQDNLEIDGNVFKEPCEDCLLEQCPHPLLDLMWGSFTNY